MIKTMVTTTDLIIRHTTTRDREDNHPIETTIFRMVVSDLKEGRTEIAVEIITTILRTPEIIMVGDRIRTRINQARTTSVERRISTLLEIAIEMMTTNLMTNRAIPARSHKMTLGRRKTQFVRVFPMTLPVWNLSTRVLLAQIPFLKLSTHHSPTNRIVLEARSIQSAMNVLMLLNRCRLKRLVLRFCRSFQTFVLIYHISPFEIYRYWIQGNVLEPTLIALQKRCNDA